MFLKIKSAKKPNSSVPGDIPKKLIKEFSIELAGPATSMFNKALKKLEYPSEWKKEYATPIAKTKHPETMDDLRLISLTKFLSKIFESFIAAWILEIVGAKLDPSQFGGSKGTSITHYLIHLINFVLANLESNEPTAIIAAIVDFQKAFNRMSHLRLIIIMNELGIPGWLLKIFSSYLSKRTLVVRHNGSTSTEQDMPGGSPQGTILGVLAFVLQMQFLRAYPLLGNPTATIPNLQPRALSLPAPQPEILTAAGVRHQNTSCKFIDDYTAASVIRLKPSLEVDPLPTHPVVFHSRTGHTLPSNKNPIVNQIDNVIDLSLIHI